MFNILGSILRHGARGDKVHEPESHKARRDRLRHEEDRRREQAEFDRLVRFRRGYW